MVAVNLNSAVGEVLGTLHWTPAQKLAYTNKNYTGSMTGVLITPFDMVDGLASVQLGLSVKEFRALPSNLRKLYRDKARNRYPIARTDKINAGTAITYLGGSEYASVTYDFQRRDDGYGLTAVHVDLELLIGFIPEWGNGTSQANLDARALAIKKMGWTANKTVEHAKAIRRERNISIRTVFDGMIKHRNAGLSASATIRKLI